ncbi:hypothetical protein ACFYNO_35380 [Kitasatospora sp. NPDC006697]|uniref:hypothetical protein n=1 Tax=Kitasatospora sp. NPDC006697 TaxID=3364020 RepID=UPI00368C570C
MNHNDVARVRDLPSRSLEPRPLTRSLGCDDDGLPEDFAPRRLLRPHDDRPLVRSIGHDR